MDTMVRRMLHRYACFASFTHAYLQSHVRHIPELVVVIFYMITETKALKNLSATSPMLWELSQRSEWASTNLAACLPIPLAKDLKFRNHHALNDLLLVNKKLSTSGISH